MRAETLKGHLDFLLLASSWAVESGRRRRVYRLTARGRRALAGARREWRGFTKAVEAVVA